MPTFLTASTEPAKKTGGVGGMELAWKKVERKWAPIMPRRVGILTVDIEKEWE